MANVNNQLDTLDNLETYLDRLHHDGILSLNEVDKVMRYALGLAITNKVVKI